MNWDIQGCKGKCIKCNKDFNDEEIYHCQLFMEKDGPKREDYCVNCWGQKEKPKAAYSSWQGRYKVQPVEVKEEPLDEPVLKILLKKWLHSTERIHRCFCYVLAIMLERNKTFSEKPEIVGESGKRQLIYEDRETGETYILEDPGLILKELGESEGQIREMLKEELRGQNDNVTL